MQRRVAVLLGAFILICFSLNKNLDSQNLFFWAPLGFLFCFYLLMRGDLFSTAAIIGLFIFLILHAVSQTYNLLYLVLIPLSGVSIWVVFLYIRNWDQKINKAEGKKELVQKETETLQERFRIRLESLHHLEQRVAGLIHLFEMARDFNECLNFSETLSILEQKIAPELFFARGTIILLGPSPETDKRISHCLPFGPQKRENQTLSERFAQECLKVSIVLDRVIKLESRADGEAARFIDHETIFPLWLFPLSAERQLIAILAVEGGETNDFQKFEILASQLMLQIKKVRLYETVKETSIVDGLTNVFVRRHFLERFGEELKRALRYRFPVSVLMVDVDHFKSYNDKFGHLVGDRTLREVAQVIRDNVRRVDVIGRYGGEEFVIAAPEIEKKEGLELAERIRSAVARSRFRLYDEETQVTVSIGLSSFPKDLGEEPRSERLEVYLTALIQKADQALYQAKQEGRNRVTSYL